MTTTHKTPSGLAYDVVDLVAPWAGRRPPVLFHHGIGTNRSVWSDWLPAIATSHRCVRFDTRGFGQSAVPPEDHQWTLENCLADLMEIVALADAPRVHIVGESFGGTIALLAAIRHPEKVATVTISNAAYKGLGIKYVAGWRESFAQQGVPTWSRDMMDKRFAPGALDDARRNWFRKVQDESPGHVMAGLGELLAATDLTEEVRTLSVPLLILMPDRSPFVTARMAAELAELVPSAELCMFPGARHGLPFSHGAECGLRLARHLDTWQAGATRD